MDRINVKDFYDLSTVMITESQHVLEVVHDIGARRKLFLEFKIRYTSCIKIKFAHLVSFALLLERVRRNLT